MEFSEYLAELFESVLDGKLNELSDEKKQLLAKAIEVATDKLQQV